MLRRDFLSDLTRAAAFCAVVPNVWRVTVRPHLVDNPFALGVASGDPTSSGAVLWTRLAPRPLEPEGGMDGQRTVVSWEVAEDENFARVKATGRATAAPELSYSVHVNVTGLESNRWYFYRFHAGDVTSPTGRVRTTPAPGALTPMRLAFASCSNFETGYFTAYGHMAREEVDLISHLGDYFYEYSGSDGHPRRHFGLEIRTLDDYRRRYAQYKTDVDLRRAHERCPWLVIWDDHEVDNNYAGLVGENLMESEEQMRSRRAAAYQAWWEHMPVQVPRAKSWSDLTITRNIDWGAVARFYMLDTRQYRTDQPCGDGTKAPCAEWSDPSHTLMGDAQEKWVVDGLETSKAHWQVLANQVMMAPYDSAPGDVVRVSMDQWSGYPVARDRLLNAIAQRAPNRTVVITGDIHSNWVNELHSDFSGAARPVIGAEFVATSITSGGDGSPVQSAALKAALPENPHVKWQNNQRGYVYCQVDEKSWTSEYRVVPYVTRPDAPIETPARWRVTNGRAGIEKV